jgi:multiple sugar transport system permease protein
MKLTHRLSAITKDRSQAYIFLIPVFLYLLVLSLYPLGYSLYLSLTDWSILRKSELVSFRGLKNFFVLFQDTSFQTSMFFTLKFFTVALPLEILLGLALALIITYERLPRQAANIFRIIIVMPIIVIPSVAGIIWRTLFLIRYGPINYLFSLLGIPEIPWLGEPGWAFISVQMVELWRYNPLVTLIFVGGLLGVPKDQVDSAHIDGCSSLQVFQHVYIPYLKPIFLVVLLIRTMSLLKRFDFIYTLTGGGPGFATEVATLYIQRTAIEDFNFNMAAAASWILLLVVLPFSLFMIFRMFAPRD